MLNPSLRSSMAFNCYAIASLTVILLTSGLATAQNAPEQVHISMGGEFEQILVLKIFG